MGIVVRTPNRVDLAGGTLDIYPLYLFEGGSVTVNIAIQLWSTTTIEKQRDLKIHLKSDDLKKEILFESFEACHVNNELDLLCRAVLYYAPKQGFKMTTKNEAPHGSGLGASSALLMAVSAGLNELGKSGLSIAEIIDVGSSLEAQTIRIPTGKQDYLAAMHGGINAFRFSEAGITRHKIDYSRKEIEALESRMILSYTGIPHFSGENNWTIMRRYIDGESSTVSALRNIKGTALKMRDAVIKRDWDAIAELLKEEWENRKALAVGVTTPVVEHLMAKAKEAGAKASKLCGAGGGGCMITWVDPDKKERVSKVLAKEGASLLPFKVSEEGLQIQSDRSSKKISLSKKTLKS